MMKTQKETKKMIYLQERDLIEGLVNDEATVSQRSGSGIYEKHLLDSMLPENGNAAACVRLLYSVSLEKAFEGVFSNLAAGIDWESAETNARPLVEHYHSISVHSAPPTGEETEWPYIVNQLDSIAERLERGAEAEPDTSRELAKDADFVREIIAEIEKNPSYIRFVTITGLILSNWKWLNNYTRTFRLLSAVASIQRGIMNNSETRFKFVQILKEISKEWKH